MADYLLAIDQGTSSTRAMIFSTQGAIIGQAQRPIECFYPKDGWVEQDASQIWTETLAVCSDAIQNANKTAEDISAIGITNQRETTVAWDKQTGRPLAEAIVWQDRRGADLCAQWQAAGLSESVTEKTGLLLDPYFSASKMHWLLKENPAVKAAADAGDLCFGTVDSFLLWKLTGGKVFATDATNACRTLLYNIQTQNWDESLCSAFSIPMGTLPEVKPSVSHFGESEASLLGRSIPVWSMIGDQQSATVGQACVAPGMAKATFGTGCFMMCHTGEQPVFSQHKLLTTLASKQSSQTHYALEGSVFVAGAAVQWLRDEMGFIDHAKDSAELAASVPNSGGVVVVPAFTGLGAPYWDPNARGAIVGLTRDSSRAHIVRATLESICFQVRDLIEAMNADSGAPLTTLRVDGGMVANDWFNQALANCLQIEVARPKVIETTAVGAAFLAGLGAGKFEKLTDVESFWQLDQAYQPQQAQADSDAAYAAWQKAIRQVQTA